MINFIKKEPLTGTSCAYFRYMYILLHLYFAQRDSDFLMQGLCHFSVSPALGNREVNSAFQRKAVQV
jgi:hypothetical protein